MTDLQVYKLNNLIEGVILNRPSKSCRSPYVADVMVDGEIIVAHAPSLGCCGYCDKGSTILMTKNENSTKVCTHTIYLSKQQEKGYDYIIGMHPKVAERMVENMLKKNIIPSILNIQKLDREKKFMNSRFDFTGIDENGKKFILEVKSVPCADYEDIPSKERVKRDYTSWKHDSKIAYFPDGYRKNVKDTVSPRALKHIQELEKLKQENPEVRTILVFVIQRSDCVHFQPSNIDMIYKNAVLSGYNSGVEIIPLCVVWNQEGECVFDRVLPLKF